MIITVAKAEKAKLDPAAAEIISLLAEGSFRDAHGVLQKVISASSDKELTVAEVERVTGAPQSTLVNQFIEAIDRKDTNAGLSVLSDIEEQATDTQIFMKLVLHKVRSILLLRFAQNLEPLIEAQFSDTDVAFLKEISARAGSSVNARALHSLLGAQTKLGATHIPTLPLELALIELSEESTK